MSGGFNQIDFTPVFQLMVIGVVAIVAVGFFLLFTFWSLLFWLPFSPFWAFAILIIGPIWAWCLKKYG